MSSVNTTGNAADNITMFDAETLRDPYPTYKKLRDTAPVYFTPDMGVHVVTRYDLVREAIRDTKTYSSQYDEFLQRSRVMMFQSMPPDAQQKLIDIDKDMIDVPPTMLTLDEPHHTQYRSLVSELFLASRIKAAEPSVQAVIDKAADKLLGRNEADYMELFAFPVPLQIIGDRIGIPQEDRPFFDDAATAAASGLRLSPLTPDEAVRRAQLALDLQKLMVGLAQARRKDPQEDMITILANAELAEAKRPLTDGEILSILGQFLVAGHETTTSTFGWGMYLLAQNPELQDRLRDDPSLTKTFVEEALRMEAPVQGLPRLVTEDTELGGYPLKAGDTIILRYAAANRDERQFADPDVVNLDRQKAGMQLAFGAGVHFCIGAPLARQELNLGFPAVLSRIKNIRIDDSKPEPEAEPSFILRNLPQLHIRYDLV